MHSISEIIAFVFLDVAIVIVVARLMGKLFTRIAQPAVVGEIIAGILLGPTLLGLFPGDLDVELFPTDVRPYLTVLANLGLVLFMFIVGLEVDLALVRGRERIASSVSLASVLLPFGLGMGLAAVLYSEHKRVNDEQVPFASYALFVGVAMSITAFPVLARILGDRGMQRTPTGVLALACAAVDDVLAWILLAVVVAVTVGGDFTGVTEILLKTAAFGLVMFLVVRPLLRLMVGRYQKAGRLTPDMLATVLVGILLSAYATEKVGIHFIFGAFIFGVVMPRKAAAALTREILERLEQVSILLLLPIFFVVTGLGVDISAIGVRGLGELVLVLLVAVVGKFSGAYLAARVQRVPHRQATALGTLMNTRGLTELVILQVGVQLRVLDQTMFTLLVIMAVVTTVMTAPLLRLFYPARLLQRDIEEAEQLSLGTRGAYTVLVITDQRDTDAALVEFACDVVGHQEPSEVLIARLLPRRPALEVASGLGVELAQIASAGDELRRLAELVQARGVQSSVHTSLANDQLTDVVELAARADADVLVVYEDWLAARSSSGDPSVSQPWPAQMAATVIVVPAAGLSEPGGTVLVALDGRADSPAALRVGVQASLGRGAGLELLGVGGTRAERRAGSTAEALRRIGVAAATRDADLGLAGPAVIFAGAATPVGAGELTGALVRVISGTKDADRELSEVAAQITVRQPTS